MFGLGKVPGLNLADENPGLVPSTEWKAKAFSKPEDQKWYPGETLSVAIGQGANVATPLQMARAIAAVVNDGKLVRPSLVKRIEAVDGSWQENQFPTVVDNKADIEPWILEAVKKALVGVVNEPSGTGHRAQVSKDLGVTVAGKTGTSQIVSLHIHRQDTGQYEHHAWFVGYAPAEAPRIVVAALVEHGGGGGKAAAPLVSQVIEAYLRANPLPNLQPSSNQQIENLGGQT
jgi:penicillin-binding protein 2